jgi:hypothetical protein
VEESEDSEKSIVEDKFISKNSAKRIMKLNPNQISKKKNNFSRATMPKS